MIEWDGDARRNIGVVKLDSSLGSKEMHGCYGRSNDRDMLYKKKFFPTM